MQRLVVCAAHADADRIGVEGGCTGEHQHVAVLRIDRNDCAAPTVQRPVSGDLGADIDRQHEVLAGHRGFVAELLHDAAARVYQDVLVPNVAVQDRLVTVLERDLADQRRARIVALVDRLEIRGADAADVTERMRDGLTVGIVAREPRANLDTGEAWAIHRESRDFVVQEALANRDRLEPTVRPDPRVDLADVVGIDQAHRRKACQGVVQVRNLFGCELQLIARHVLGQDDAVAVEDQAARGWDGLYPDPVALRLRREILVFEDLQLRESADDDSDQTEYQQG